MRGFRKVVLVLLLALLFGLRRMEILTNQFPDYTVEQGELFRLQLSAEQGWLHLMGWRLPLPSEVQRLVQFLGE